MDSSNVVTPMKDNNAEHRRLIAESQRDLNKLADSIAQRADALDLDDENRRNNADLFAGPGDWRHRPRWTAQPPRHRGLDTAPAPDWSEIDQRITDALRAHERRIAARLDAISARVVDLDQRSLDTL